jgi:hypothetical protein
MGRGFPLPDRQGLTDRLVPDQIYIFAVVNREKIGKDGVGSAKVWAHGEAANANG